MGAIPLKLEELHAFKQAENLAQQQLRALMHLADLQGQADGVAVS